MNGGLDARKLPLNMTDEKDRQTPVQRLKGLLRADSQVTRLMTAVQRRMGPRWKVRTKTTTPQRHWLWCEGPLLDAAVPNPSSCCVCDAIVVNQR